MTLQQLQEEIENILSEYPSHPPMAGSEQGLNMVTVDKLKALITQTAEAERERILELYEAYPYKDPELDSFFSAIKDTKL
jgi:hypothetical protein